MPRKKSIKKAAQDFDAATAKITDFVNQTANLDKTFRAWCMDYAVIRLYREFETMILSALVGAINNDTTTLTYSFDVRFPKHLSQDVCTFLIVGDGYFDFRGRAGLIRIVKKFVPDGHYLCEIIKKSAYRDSLERLSALRNFAAHHSEKAKKAAVQAIGGEKLGSSGGWLSSQNRFHDLCESLNSLAREIQTKAPF